MFFGAEFIAGTIVGDPRAADSLKTLTISLPFIGMSSCFKGYFIARKNTAPASSSQIFEQLVRIALITFLVGKAGASDIGKACRWVIFGDSIAEVFSFIYVYISYLRDKKRHISKKGGEKPAYSVLLKLKHIALPITVGRYLNSFLRTAENVLVPQQLEKNGMNGNDALSVFGVIKGMALPLIFFPASFLNALSTLLIPEMSEAAASGRELKVKYTAEKCIHITLISSLPIAVIFYFAALPLGNLVYGDPLAGEVIKLLAPIIPLMYMDSVCDGLLKGLDQQFSIFRNSMLDSLGRLALIMFLLPKYGLYGFVGIMYVSNLFTCSMNLFRLKKISKARLPWFMWLVLPGVAAICFGTIIYLLLDIFALPNLPFTIIYSLLTLAAYLIFVLRFKCISIDDLR
jgi:stage V sporulation protein B